MNWNDIEGWFSGADVQFVQQICGGIHDGVVVELGFFAGKTTAAMAPICKTNHNKYHAVDNCKGANPRDPATKAQQSRNMFKVFESNMEQMKLLEYLNTHIADSAEAAQIFDDESVDFCFVDASHVEEDVVRDIKAWWPKIKVGGTLGGHDYTWGSVKNATGAFVEEHGLKLVVSGNCWKFTKQK